MTSKIGICNQALAALGEDSIRDFVEGNKRARMCDVFFDVVRDYLVGQFDWAFARKRAELKALAVSESWTPDGVYAYALPADCRFPLFIWPEKAFIEFEVLGEELHTKINPSESTVVLVYTHYGLDPSKYSTQFANLLSVLLAVKICMPITQDSALVKVLLQQYEMEKREVWAADAALGNKHLHSDADANLDSFVDADWSTRFTEGTN